MLTWWSRIWSRHASRLYLITKFLCRFKMDMKPKAAYLKLSSQSIQSILNNRTATRFSYIQWIQIKKLGHFCLGKKQWTFLLAVLFLKFWTNSWLNSWKVGKLYYTNDQLLKLIKRSSKSFRRKTMKEGFCITKTFDTQSQFWRTLMRCYTTQCEQATIAFFKNLMTTPNGKSTLRAMRLTMLHLRKK